jgi:hypothetical protein
MMATGAPDESAGHPPGHSAAAPAFQLQLAADHTAWRWDPGRRRAGVVQSSRSPMMAPAIGEDRPARLQGQRSLRPDGREPHQARALEPRPAARPSPCRSSCSRRSSGRTKWCPSPAARSSCRCAPRSSIDEPIDGRFRATLFHTLVIPVNAAVTEHAIVLPALSVTSIAPATGNAVTISVKVADAHLHFLTLFQEEEKIDLIPGSKLGPDGTYVAKVTLKPGMNAVRVMASDQDDINEILPLRLWGEGSVTTAAGK